jgi:SagB-type dehydrogenase family enzyme
VDKLAWVLLPLAGAGLAVALLAWRGRLPSRLALNVGSSLLLLVYLSVTAGLGIFWVAQQHLPVFDWHYLFGYATVLLLLVHLGFNFRIVWNWLRRGRKAVVAPPAQNAAAVSRRPVVGALGVAGGALALGGAYWLGLRHGRTELRIEAAAPGTAPTQATALALVEQFHEFSSHSRLGSFRRAAGSDWGDPPPPFKRHPGAPLNALPPPWRDAASVPRQRTAALDAARLGTLLWMVAGVSLWRGGIPFRTSPSSGALFATELYVQTFEQDGTLPAALWHYESESHGLERLPARRPAESFAAPPPGALAAIVATAIFQRSGHKYRDRTYRYVLADLGHALENLRAAAGALGLAVQFDTAFDDAPWSQALGLDAAREGVLAVAWLVPAAPEAATALHRLGPWQPALPAANEALALTDAVHRATSLRAIAPGPATAPAPQPQPTAEAPMPDLLALIATRRSERRYRREPLPQTALMQMLAALRGPGPVFSSAVRVDVVAQAVADVAAGLWRFDASTGRLSPGPPAANATELRQRSRSAGLGQDVIGDAAAVLIFSIERARWTADTTGAARGWRHAFLEAGLMGERLYFAAPPLGLGVCAVGAFYDDEAVALIGAEAKQTWPVHFAAIGRI